ncbi:hypothetical protein ACFQZ8_18110, partial [Micromonospora azadirachtae]
MRRRSYRAAETNPHFDMEQRGGENATKGNRPTPLGPVADHSAEVRRRRGRKGRRVRPVERRALIATEHRHP